MQAFEYANPATLQEAVAMLGSSWGEADILAGGTDLISLMKDYIHTPKRVVNIKGLKELQGITKTATGLRIGAVVTFDEVAESPLIRSEYPSIVQAVLGVASPQIRNMGTVGGDLCQRNRCWYFRQGFGTLGKDKDGTSLPPIGENRYHAIFPKGDAYFVSASSLGPPLIALGAKVKIAGPSGSREIPVEELFVVPTSNKGREVSLAPNEILTEILIPSARGVRNATYEVRHKQALDWPLATASVALRMKGSTVASAKIVLGHVGPTPVIATEAEALLAGKALTPDLAAEAGKVAVNGAKPLSGNEYKVQLTRVAVKRALMEAMKARA
ncbi:MAG: xanthine dehydrogenase family protein subunit M [Bryobacteraceae bacterium]|nr:xanthine dehydrogenase family protein subunit M [Bryobacteraceae bacterium]MDW8376941.1 xanthine dehydrogenase family protein subunit M [Bryobacterales bacterium]